MIVYVSVVITDNPRGEESTGEVSIQVDLFTHPGTGEHKVTVKGKTQVLKSCRGKCPFQNFPREGALTPRGMGVSHLFCQNFLKTA